MADILLCVSLYIYIYMCARACVRVFKKKKKKKNFFLKLQICLVHLKLISFTRFSHTLALLHSNSNQTKSSRLATPYSSNLRSPKHLKLLQWIWGFVNGLGLEDWVWLRVREVGATAWAILVIFFSFFFFFFFLENQDSKILLT